MLSLHLNKYKLAEKLMRRKIIQDQFKAKYAPNLMRWLYITQ